MMYEPNERTQTTNVQELKNDIENNVICGSDFLQVAMENQKMVGYIRAERGKFNRILHTAYIVVGILKDYRGKGIGTSFFEMLNCWAKENGIKRLELTVECCNETLPGQQREAVWGSPSLRVLPNCKKVFFRSS